MSRRPVYDRIGPGYAVRRRPEPRWQAVVVALEPSAEMIAQRSSGNPVVQGARHRDLLTLDELDLGYLLVLAGSS